MYIPLDPKKIEGCWDKFAITLSGKKLICSIHDGSDVTGHAFKTEKRSKDIIDIMKKSDFVRIGSNRTEIMPVHFAINFLNKDKAKLVEMINSDSSTDTLRNELNLAIQLIFFENIGLQELILPNINEISNPDFEVIVDKFKQESVIRRR